MIWRISGLFWAFDSGSWCHRLLLFAIWSTIYHNQLTLQTSLVPAHISSTSMLKASPPKSGIFKPIEISPAVIPHSQFPGDPLPPMYPTFPPTYDPVLTGRCPVNFSAISNIMDKTASDCNRIFAPVLGNVICCPQFSSLLHIFQGFYSNSSDNLVLLNAVADDCFKDIINILASRGANGSIPAICSVKSSNLTGGSCPVKDINNFEEIVNTSKLLEACTTVDPLKECCRPICQPAIIEASLKLSGTQSFVNNDTNHLNMLNDCKGVVYSWMSRTLPHDAANTAYRILSACKVNKACPLDLKQPSEVIVACKNVAASSPSCCSSLNTYIAGIQKQMLITNRQAIICAARLGSMLQKGGVMTNIFELCDVDLKDFSLQTADGQQGCLLHSLPADLVYDKSAGLSITCDLNDNIAAPWPSSSSLTSLSLCAPEMSLPALPTSETLGNLGYRGGWTDLFVPILSFFVLEHY
ncbi:uncharacterized GPI-anchored protein At1g61900-like isoform X2 [Olea europaea var. sylvestris]|uniref:uncharacterized GPI-anchored protein At1g61900-like isoform X1 n=1 Tax=Olea europaea var. sylvestris TaxID=158386 RepID=UPI000C1CE1F1|nr:uncharacterized GPI-anchored protein At1g61900-like isoform X1 [Olea europaea var. sylvestris]XP_022871632.1 uncharacterized GPI-anchored protein At1g61900-like isoform X2 [Olea europaea var. sylvestris]